MITLFGIIAFLSLIMFAVAICIIFGGVTGLMIVGDLVVFFFICGFLLKLLFGR